jgi:uncharacterized protein (DUF58 family)
MAPTTSRPRITQTGIVVLLSGAAMGVLGVVFGYRALSVMSASILLGCLLAALSTLSVPVLDIKRVVEPQRVSRGTPAHGLVSVKNVRKRRSRACFATEQVGSRSVQVRIPALGPRRSIVVPYELATHRRGQLEVGPLVIRRQDPFGLFAASRMVGDTTTVLVEPNVMALDPRPSGRLRHLEGPRSDRSTQGTMTFHSLREYTRGDDIRQVHWRSSARTGTLMVKEHVDTSLPSTVVVLDTCADHYSDDLFEDAVDVAASVVVASQNRNFPVRLVTSSGTSLLVRAGQRGQELRNLLATVAADDRSKLDTATGLVLRGHDHDTLVVIGGELQLNDLSQVSSMARRFASPILVTLRPNGGVRWNLGLHLDGDSATSALNRWQFGTDVRSAAS